MKKEIIKTEIIVKDTPISVIRINKTDFISLTDLAKYQNSSDPSFTVKNWLRRVTTIDYIGLWEQLHNPNFNLVEFDQIKTEYGKNSFAMSPTQWIKRTNSIGIIAKGGRYSIGTFAHQQYVYANEADVLNVALFGITAKEWRDKNPNLDGNIRDYTDILHLVVLANLENLNAEMIASGLSQSERIVKLNNTAKKQLQLLQDSCSVKRLEHMDKQLNLE